ncbi:hypothetical protein [Sphingomonas aquatilis]
MICPGCGAKNTEHAYARTENPPCASWPKCIRCGEAHNGGANYVAGRTRDICEEIGACYTCAIREENARDYAAGKMRNALVIDGALYSFDPSNTVPLGAPDPHPRQPMRGMAGRRFDFQKLDGSAPKSCYSLWYGSPVDEWSRDRMPDNAVFLGGAERTQAGDITCFNPSSAQVSA